MNGYYIYGELESGLEFPVPLTISGFTFQTLGGVGSGRVEVRGEWEANDFATAVRDYENRMREVLDALTAGRLVALSSYGGSLFVTKSGSNVAYLHHWKADREAILLTPSHPKAELAALESAATELGSDGDLVNAARHYRESLLYPSALVAAMHLLRAAEALAGVVAATGRCSKCGNDLRCGECGQPHVYRRSSHERLAEIMGEDAYRYFYREPGLRNLLMHGAEIDQEEMVEQVSPLRAGVQRRLRAELELPDQPPLERPRSLFGYRGASLWLETSSTFPSFGELLSRVDGLDFTSDPRLLGPGDEKRIIGF